MSEQFRKGKKSASKIILKMLTLSSKETVPGSEYFFSSKAIFLLFFDDKCSRMVAYHYNLLFPIRGRKRCLSSDSKGLIFLQYFLYLTSTPTCTPASFIINSYRMEISSFLCWSFLPKKIFSTVLFSSIICCCVVVVKKWS